MAYFNFFQTMCDWGCTNFAGSNAYCDYMLFVHFDEENSEVLWIIYAVPAPLPDEGSLGGGEKSLARS
ncbi:hypothetical protein Trydic_g21065 [Trypoxylus dichotomus]